MAKHLGCAKQFAADQVAHGFFTHSKVGCCLLNGVIGLGTGLLYCPEDGACCTAGGTRSYVDIVCTRSFGGRDCTRSRIELHKERGPRNGNSVRPQAPIYRLRNVGPSRVRFGQICAWPLDPLWGAFFSSLLNSEF